MNNRNNFSRHSFLFWMIVPLLLTWIGVNYLFGVLATKPQWANPGAGGPAAVSASVVAPVTHYDDIQRTSSGMVTLWFDDAWLSQYMTVSPLLRVSGFQGALAVPTDMVGMKGYANWAQIRALEQDGWEITNHSVSHDCTMQTWGSERIRQEILAARDALWRNRLPSDIFVSPCGVESAQLLEEVSKEFAGFRGTQDGYNNFNNFDPYSLKVMTVTNQTTLGEVKGWIDEAKKTDTWLILVFHQVGDKVDGVGEKYWIPTDMFTNILDYIQDQQIQVVLPSQAMKFVKEIHSNFDLRIYPK